MKIIKKKGEAKKIKRRRRKRKEICMGMMMMKKKKREKAKIKTKMKAKKMKVAKGEVICHLNLKILPGVFCHKLDQNCMAKILM